MVKGTESGAVVSAWPRTFLRFSMPTCHASSHLISPPTETYLSEGVIRRSQLRQGANEDAAAEGTVVAR
jgi:hypothetical protein